MDLKDRIQLLLKGEILNPENLNRSVVELADLVQDELDPLPKIGNPTGLSNIKEILNIQLSSGVISGLEVINNNNGTIGITSGEAILKNLGQVYLVSFDAVPVMNINNFDASYVYIDFNNSIPFVSVTTDPYSINGVDTALVAIVSRENNHLHIINGTQQNTDTNRKTIRRMLETDTFKHVPGGSILGSVGLNLTLSAGKFWFGLSPMTHGAVDTSITGFNYSTAFSSYYENGGMNGWTKLENQKVIDNLNYNDISTGTLKESKKDRYVVHWVYLFLGNPGTSHISTIYGREDHKKLEDAKAETVPSTLPGVFRGNSVLLGRVIVQKNKNILEVESSFGSVFNSSSPTAHNDLSSLQGGIDNEYYHLSQEQYNTLLLMIDAYNLANP